MPLPRLDPKPAPPVLTPGTTPTGIPIPAAIDRAIQESVANNDTNTFLPSLEGNLQSSDFLLDVTRRMYSEISSESLQSSFVAEVNQAKTPEEIAQITRRYESSIRKQTADIRTLGYLNFLKQVPSDYYTFDAYNVYAAEFQTPESLQNLRVSSNEAYMDEMRWIVNEYVGDKGFSGFREAAEEVIKSAVLPFQEPVINAIAEDAGALDTSGRFTMSGFSRQEVRDYLSGLSEDERRETVQNLIKALKEAENSTLTGQIMADFAVADYVQSVLSDDVLSGKGGPDNVDIWVTNAINVLDTIWVGGVVARATRGAGKGLKSLFANRLSRQSLRTASTVSTPRATDIVATLRDKVEVRDALKITPDEVISSKLPVPEDMLDDLVVIPDEVRDIIPELAARRAQVDALVARNPRTWLNTAQKNDLISQEMQALESASRGVLRVSNSTIETLGADEGFRIKALVAANEISGWKGSPGLTDVLQVIQDFNPAKVGLELLYKQEDGTLGVAYEVSRREGATRYLPHFEMEIARNTGLTPNSEFFIRVTKERLWTPEEKVLFGENPVIRSGMFTDVFDTPNYRFSQELYNGTLQATSVEQTVAAQLNEMLKPVWNLSDSDKRFVFSTYRWTNEFAQRTGKNPRLADYKAAFPEMTDKQATALYAMRYTQDTWFIQLNKRLYRNWQGQGYVTGVSHNDALPVFHGKKIPQETIREGEYFYDPVTRMPRQLNEEEIKSLYANNGGVLEIDLPIGLPSSPRTMFTKIIVSKDAGYSIEALHTNVLPYHPGYFPNFNEDSFLIVKRYDSININGVERSIKMSNKNSPEFSVAIRTADSLGRARQMIGRFNARRGARARGYQYDVVPVKDLTVQERSAQLNHLLNRQGRMFYDKRDYRVLRNLDGKMTELADPVQGMEQVVGAIARQLGMEDTMRSIKIKFRQQFPELITDDQWRTKNSLEIQQLLEAQRSNAVVGGDPILKRRTQDALSLWKHIRMLDGVDSDLFGALRAWSLDKASALNSATIDRAVINMAPMQVARSVAFKAFMVTRPVRQALLQSMQVLFLAPIDPLYVGSGKVLLDGLAARIGIAKLKGLDTDWSNGVLATLMGVSKEDYNTLIREMDKGGLLHHVDVHAFAGGSRAHKKLSLPKSVVGSVLQTPLKVGSWTMEKLQRFGFDLGERNNLTFTYLIALRRKMREGGYKRYRDLTSKDWDDVRNDASNLSFGMIRINQFPYQQGTLALTTQFLSFSHKAALALLGRNPALKKADVLKIWAGTALLFGSSMFGASDWVEKWLNSQAGADALSPGLRETLIRILSNGLIDTILNKTGNALVNDWKDLDMAGFAPGPGNIVNFYDTVLTAATEGPALPMFLGPVQNLSGNAMVGISTAVGLYKGDPDMSEADKFMIAANEILRNGIPGYNDVNTAYDMWKLKDWYSKSGNNADVRATWNTIIAKGLLNVNSEEINAYWAIRDSEVQRREAIQNRVQVDKARIQRVVNLYGQGTETMEGLIQTAIMIGNFTQDLPEEDQALYYSMMNNVEFGGFSMNTYISDLIARGYFDKGMLHNAGKLEAISEEDKQALEVYITRFQEELAETNAYRTNRTEVFELEQKQDAR